MRLKGDSLSELLRDFSLPVSGKVNDKRLRLYEYICTERAAENAEVEAAFQKIF
jgi:hypothetical protein